MPLLHTFDAWIETEGARLPEYGHRVAEDGNTIRCWIPSENGKNFKIVWTIKGKRMATVGEVTVDGYYVTGLVDEGLVPHPAKYSLAGFEIGGNMEALFEFGKLLLTDDESVAVHVDDTQMGSICLEIYDGTIGKSGPFEEHARLNQGPLHEETKKCGYHRVIVGKSVPLDAEFVDFKEIGPPRARFIFEYRPKDLLLAKGIITTSDCADPCPQADKSVSRVPRHTDEHATARTKQKPQPRGGHVTTDAYARTKQRVQPRAGQAGQAGQAASDLATPKPSAKRPRDDDDGTKKVKRPKV